MLATLFQNSSNLVDIGFTVFTTAICIKFLTEQTIDNEKAISHWRKELKGLEQTIRALITEATTANNSLDRTLVKRKSDLEKLLHKLEKVENKLDQTEELPNESWRRREEDIRLEHLAEEDPLELSFLAEDTRDSVSLSTKHSSSLNTNSRRVVSAKTAPQAKTQTTKNLREQIEIRKPNIKQEQIGTSILEPVTLKVAKRMLAQGKEIHVVAKKLDLSVSQIRVLDRMLREQGMESEAGPNFKKLEAIPATKIVRNKGERREESKNSLDQADFMNRAFELGEDNIVDGEFLEFDNTL